MPEPINLLGILRKILFFPILKWSNFSYSKELPILSYFFFLAIAFILANRELNATDDLNYMAYFEETYLKQFDNFWLYFIEEPLWRLYSSLMGNILNAEDLLRITIFISTIAFLYSGSKLGHGAWVLIFFAFLVDGSLATQMYYNQIRQGVALSIFMLTIVLGGGPILGAITAAAIHSSFLVVLPCIIISILIIRKKFILFATTVFIILLIILTMQLNNIDFLYGIDLGRRSEMYEFTGVLNVKFYLVALIQYGVTLYLARPRPEEDDFSYWWFCMTFIFTIVTFGVTLFHEAGGRLMYFATCFMAITLAQNIKKKRIFIASIFWFSIEISVQLYTDFKMDINSDTWLGRWVLIFS